MRTINSNQDAAEQFIAEMLAATEKRRAGADAASMNYRIEVALSAAHSRAVASELDAGMELEDICVASVAAIHKLVLAVVMSDPDLERCSPKALEIGQSLLRVIGEILPQSLGPKAGSLKLVHRTLEAAGRA